jgi:Sodium/hydrogen exchanger family
MPELSLAGVVIVAAVAFLVPLLLGLAPAVRLPSVVLEIVAGIVLGPAAVGVGVARAGHSTRLSADLGRLQDSSAQIRVRGAVLLLVLLVWVAQRLGLETILGAFLAGALLRVVDRDEMMTHPKFRVKLEALGYGFLVPFFFVVSGVRFDLRALTGDPANLRLVPLFLLALLLVRGLPAWLYRPRIGTGRTVVTALLQATSLPFIVAAAQIGIELGRLDQATGAALVAAGRLSVLLFPLAALIVLRRTPGRRPPRGRPCARSAPGLGDRPGRVDQADVAERLREVADHLGAAGVDLLGQQADVAGVGDRPPEGRPGGLDLARQRLRLRQPKGAQQEGALLALQPVGGLVAVDQAALVGEPLGGGVDGRLHARVVARQEAGDRQHQVGGVQVVAAERLGVGAGAVAPAVLEDGGADLVAAGGPGFDPAGGTERPGQRDRPVQGHPAHQLGVQEVARLAADLPDPLVLLLPAAGGGVRRGGEEPLRDRVQLAQLLDQPLRGAEQLAVHVQLPLGPRPGSPGGGPSCGPTYRYGSAMWTSPGEAP